MKDIEVFPIGNKAKWEQKVPLKPLKIFEHTKSKTNNK